MKKNLMLLFVVGLLASCTSSLTQPLIVTTINEVSDLRPIVGRNYLFQVNNMTVNFYTDSLYQIGDTIK